MISIEKQLLAQMRSVSPSHVWSSVDFESPSSRNVIRATLNRLVRQGKIRRISRGFYDFPWFNPLTQQYTSPDPYALINAIARRDGLRLLIDELTAANDLGFTDAVPARIRFYVNGRYKPVKLGSLTVELKFAPLHRMYWADKPAMRVVQALYWLEDMLPGDEKIILNRLAKIIDSSDSGQNIYHDVMNGFDMLPFWMQSLLSKIPELSGIMK